MARTKKVFFVNASGVSARFVTKRGALQHIRFLKRANPKMKVSLTTLTLAKKSTQLKKSQRRRR